VDDCLLIELKAVETLHPVRTEITLRETRAAPQIASGGIVLTAGTTLPAAAEMDLRLKYEFPTLQLMHA
jgi:hypothetical protein